MRRAESTSSSPTTTCWWSRSGSWRTTRRFGNIRTRRSSGGRSIRGSRARRPAGCVRRSHRSVQRSRRSTTAPIPIRLDDDHPAFGANIAARTDVLRRYRFDPKLGRTGKNMLSGEETTLFASMRRDGVIGWWVPGARVRHFVPRERQTLTYLREWNAGVGWYQGMAPASPRRAVVARRAAVGVAAARRGTAAILRRQGVRAGGEMGGRPVACGKRLGLPSWSSRRSSAHTHLRAPSTRDR